jgi:cytoskeleton protein RodZ
MSTDRPVGDFGSRLREARERRGVTLRRIANSTKISISALEALERNDVSRLPGGIFSRAFVRAYAVEVGLDPEATIRDFMAVFPGHESVSAGHPSANPVDREAHESDQRLAATFLWLAAISLPLVGLLLYFGGKQHSASAARGVPQVAAPVSEGAPVDIPPPAEIVRPAVGPIAPPVTPPAPAAVPDSLTVALVAVRPCWVSATVDGSKVVERLLATGEREVLDAHRALVLTLGDASAVTLTVNGQPARGLGRAGQVVTAELNLSNVDDFLASR